MKLKKSSYLLCFSIVSLFSNHSALFLSPLEIQSDQQEIDSEGNMIFLGDVRVNAPDRLNIQAPFLTFDAKSKKINFISSFEQLVSGQFQGGSFVSTSAFVDLAVKRIELKEVHLRKERLYLSAQEAMINEKKDSVLKKVSFTLCKKEHPHWELLVNKIYLDAQQRMRCSGAIFKMGSLQIPLPISSISFDLNRKFGFLCPRFYWDRLGGFGVKQGYYVEYDRLLNQLISLHWLEKKGLIISNRLQMESENNQYAGTFFWGYGTLWQESTLKVPIHRSWLWPVDFLGEFSYKIQYNDFNVQLFFAALEQSLLGQKKEMQWLFDKQSTLSYARNFAGGICVVNEAQEGSFFSDCILFDLMKRSVKSNRFEKVERSSLHYGRVFHAEYIYNSSFFSDHLSIRYRTFCDLFLFHAQTSIWEMEHCYYQKKNILKEDSFLNMRFFSSAQIIVQSAKKKESAYLICTPGFFFSQKISKAKRIKRAVPSLCLFAEIPFVIEQFLLNKGFLDIQDSFVFELHRSSRLAADEYGDDRYDQFFDKDMFTWKQALLYGNPYFMASIKSEIGIDITEASACNPLSRGLFDGVVFPFSLDFDLMQNSYGFSLRCEGAIQRSKIYIYQVVPVAWGRYENVSIEFGYFFQLAEIAERRFFKNVESAFFLKGNIDPFEGLAFGYQVSFQPSIKTKAYINQRFDFLWKFDCWNCGIGFEQERSFFLGELIYEWRIGLHVRLLFDDK